MFLQPSLVLVWAAAVVMGCSEGTPSFVEDRRRIPECAPAYEIELPRDADSSAVECLFEAYDEGREAELAVFTRLTEGGRSKLIVRVLGPQQVEMFGTHNDEWLDYGTCTDLALHDEPKVFAVDLCTQD